MNDIGYTLIHNKSMDLPYTPKFFKKLELYQEYHRLNKRDEGYEKQQHWKADKALLGWAHENHFHVGHSLGKDSIAKGLRWSKFPAEDIKKYAPKVIENLEHRGWGTIRKKEISMGGIGIALFVDTIEINRDGMLMAEVIGDVMKKRWKRAGYFVSGWITWGIFVFMLAALILGVWKLVLDIPYF